MSVPVTKKSPFQKWLRGVMKKEESSLLTREQSKVP